MTLTPLAPVDYVFTGNTPCPVTFAFAYADRLDPKRLQRSLDRLVEQIPTLGGRLRARRGDAFAYEVPERPKLTLEVVASTCTFEQLADDDAVRLVESADGQPLVAARLTQTPGGSILAVSMSHALVDGFSFFLMMSKWAACMRGQSTEAPPTARLLQPSEAQVIAASSDLTPQSLLEQSGMFWGDRRPANELPVQDRLCLSSGAISDLIEKAQAEVPQKLRQNDVLTAWLWRKYGRRWWAGQGNPTVYVSCPVDVRRLLGEENKSLFGCTICGATTEATFEELTTAPLGELALRIQRSVAAVFEGGFEKRVAPLEALRRRHGLQAMESVHLRHPEHGMLVTNMSRLPLGDLDFGCGEPIELKLYAQIDSMAAVLPAKDGVTLGVYRPLASERERVTSRSQLRQAVA